MCQCMFDETQNNAHTQMLLFTFALYSQQSAGIVDKLTKKYMQTQTQTPTQTSVQNGKCRIELLCAERR